jgi:hypothetical protein
LFAKSRSAQRDVDAESFDDSPPPPVEKTAVVALQPGETADGVKVFLGPYVETELNDSARTIDFGIAVTY